MRSAIASMIRSQSAQQFEVLVVVGRRDRGRLALPASGAGDSLPRLAIALIDDAVRVAFLGGKVEQDGVDVGIDQVGGDLRAHHAGAEHGHLADAKL